MLIPSYFKYLYFYLFEIFYAFLMILKNDFKLLQVNNILNHKLKFTITQKANIGLPFVILLKLY